MDFDVHMDLLIALVENRPVLWDKTIDSYKSKHLKYVAWEEIYVTLKDNFEALPYKDKNKFGKCIMKKWNNARDNWMRCAKKLQECKSSLGTKSVPKYRYYDHMQFLNKIISYRPTANNMPPVDEDKESGITRKDGNTVPKKRKKKNVKDNESLSKRIASLVDTEKEDNSRIMSFFRGIAPTIEHFNDDDIVEFQYEVIKTMRNIHRRNLSAYNSSSSQSKED